MTNPSVLEKSEHENEERDDFAEKVDRARRLREAAEKQIKDRTAERSREPHWVTEKAWRSG